MSSHTPKTVASTAVENQKYKVFPNDLNSNGTVFGGLVMSLLDRLSLIVAETHSGQVCVTASVDRLHFLAPANMGDILIFSASVNRAWKTSMEVGVRVDAENYKTKERKHIVSAYFTYVALDKENKPTEIPQVVPEGKVQERRFEDAARRRANRLTESEVHKKRKG